MTDKSLCQIRWSNNRLGLMLVNPERQRFFIYVEKFLMLFDPGGLVEVKLRDRRPGRAVGYYPGQVIGRLTIQGENALITLIIGEPYHNLFTPADGGLPEDFLVKMTFVFPISEMTTIKEAIDLMSGQMSEFDDRIQAAEATPLISIPKKKKRPTQSVK